VTEPVESRSDTLKQPDDNAGELALRRDEVHDGQIYEY